MSDVVRFIRKDGRIIPIRAAGGKDHVARVAGKVGKAALKGAHVAAAGVGAHQLIKNKPTGIKVNKKFDVAGLGLSIASGGLAAATFSLGAKGLVGGHLAAHAIDVAGVAANVASVKGHGKVKQRAIQASKQEARNLLVGNAVYGAGLLATARNRKALAGYAQKIIQFGRKALRVV